MTLETKIKKRSRIIEQLSEETLCATHRELLMELYEVNDVIIRSLQSQQERINSKIKINLGALLTMRDEDFSFVPFGLLVL